MSRNGRNLSDEDKALAAYIAAMFGTEALAPAAPRPAVEPPPVAEAEDEASKLASVRRLLAETVAPLPKAEPVPPPAPPVVVPEPKPEPAVAVTPVAAEAMDEEAAPLLLPPEREVSLIPDWGEKRFQTLFFRVGPLTLAVPLSQLGGIFALDKDKLTPLFGKPKWFLGLHSVQGGNMQIVDTARWVMPEKYAEVTAEGLELEYVIRLGESPWALACTQVHDAVTLEHDDIRWRSSVGKRPWLAGVVVEKMCALLDVDNFIFLLENNQFEKRHGR